MKYLTSFNGWSICIEIHFSSPLPLHSRSLKENASFIFSRPAQRFLAYLTALAMNLVSTTQSTTLPSLLRIHYLNDCLHESLNNPHNGVLSHLAIPGGIHVRLRQARDAHRNLAALLWLAASQLPCPPYWNPNYCASFSMIPPVVLLALHPCPLKHHRMRCFSSSRGE
jgi:hypothetical protein